jgi:hypothetical protein
MGLSFTIDGHCDTDWSVNNLKAKNFCMYTGYFAYDSVSSTALTITTYLGINNVIGFVASPKDKLVFEFSPANGTIQPMCTVGSTTGLAIPLGCTASYSVDSVTSIPFLCWGFR